MVILIIFINSINNNNTSVKHILRVEINVKLKNSLPKHQERDQTKNKLKKEFKNRTLILGIISF